MNNLDTSSSGENISLDVYYDTDLTRIYYEDFINGADGNKVYTISDNREILAYLIGDYEKPYYKKAELTKMKKAELFELWLSYELGYNDKLTKADYISDLLSTTIAQHYDFIFNENNWNNVSDYFTNPYFISRGYSQGDAVYIIDVDADYDVLTQSESTNHILWDTPIRINLSVNDDDELGYELLDNCYDYEKDKVIENINKLEISDYAKTWINEHLPDQPFYS